MISKYQIIKKKVLATLRDIGTLITSNPELRGGRPIIAGTGTSVRRIAALSLFREKTPTSRGGMNHGQELLGGESWS